MKDMKIIAGLDIGNGYVKAKVDADGETFIMDAPIGCVIYCWF